ncbi:MAG: diguanylate cyclase [Magnetococcales bacterium]|nr:diguanylate cyclase [Magnetococcales bacterium]
MDIKSNTTIPEIIQGSRYVVEMALLEELSRRISRLLSLTSNQKTSVAQLVSLLSAEELLVEKILLFANSSRVGKVGKISTLSQAVIHIGFDRIRTLGIELMFYNLVVHKLQIDRFDPANFWRHCTTVAVIARAIGEKIRYQNLDEAYLVGLFHDVGKIFLYMHGAINYEEFLVVQYNHDHPMADQERSFMGSGHDELGASFLERCGFSQRLTRSVLHHHQRYDELSLGLDGARLTALVQLSDFIAWTQGVGSHQGMPGPILPPETERVINLERVGVEAIISAIEPKLASLARYYQFSLPNDHKIRENLFQANLQLGKLKTHYLYRETSQSDSEKMTQHAQMLLTPHRSLDSEVIFENTLKAIRLDMEFDEIWVFRFHQEKRLIVAEQFPGAVPFAKEGIGQQFPIDEADENVLECLRHRWPILINGKNAVELELLGFIGAKQATLVPIKGQRRIHGLACLVEKKGSVWIGEEKWRTLSSLFHEMGLALDNALLYALANERANRDKLTGIRNRSGLDDQFDEAFANARKKGQNFCVAMADIDYFKKFNDRFGHQEGDRVLKLVAQVLKKTTRANGMVGRYGGEEFMIILKNTTIDDAWAYCERIRKNVENLGRILSQRLPGQSLTISIGVAAFCADLEHAKQMIQQADQALYRAKNAGRNRVVRYQVPLPVD